MPVGESRYMEPLQLAGRLIMENGGETYRVEPEKARTFFKETVLPLVK